MYTPAGLSPVRYLEKLGILSEHLVLAHVVWVDDEEMDLLAKHNVSVVHNPASNMKLASGYTFKYDEMKRRGIRIGIGTDGCSSSNNLDMVVAMPTPSTSTPGDSKRDAWQTSASSTSIRLSSCR